MQNSRTVTIGNVHIDAETQASALARVASMVEGGGGLLFTPNVHHVVLAQHDAGFARAYARAEMSLCDGKPLQWLARLQGGLPACLPGSLMLPALLGHAARQGWSVYFVGGRIGVAERLPALVGSRYPGLRIAGISAPTSKLSSEALAKEADDIAGLKPALVCVSLSSPLQEVWADAAYRQQCHHSVFVCTGSAIDRVVGLAPSAPVGLSRAGLEWAWRIVQEPRRLAGRYASDAIGFAPIALQTLLGKQGSSGGR